MTEPLSNEDARAAFKQRVDALSQRKPRNAKPIVSKNTAENHRLYLEEMERRRRARASEEGALRERQMQTFHQRAEEWRLALPDRWRDASLAKITDERARKVLSDKIARHDNRAGRNRSSMIVAGKMGRGKTYLGYAYAYELIARGILQPHQVVTTTESTLASITRAGFKATDKWNNLIGGGKRFWLINDVGRGDFQAETKRMEVWHEFVDHIYEMRGTLVITTNLAPVAKRSNNPDNMALDRWVGNSTFDRLAHMVNEEGMVIMTGANKRQEVGDNLEDEYRRKK